MSKRKFESAYEDSLRQETGAYRATAAVCTVYMLSLLLYSAAQTN